LVILLLLVFGWWLFGGTFWGTRWGLLSVLVFNSFWHLLVVMQSLLHLVLLLLLASCFLGLSLELHLVVDLVDLCLPLFLLICKVFHLLV